jgi:AcrR family transcriptional regulator
MQIVPIRTATPAPLGKRAQTRAENRRTILDAARRVFAEKGFGPARIRDIIRATPLASGTFYNYFRSKEEVFQALCDEAANSVAPAMRDARRTAKSPEAFLVATFRGFFHLFSESRACGMAPEPLFGAPGSRRIDELKQDIESAVAQGMLPSVNPQVLASAIWGLAAGLAESLPEWSNIEDAACSASAFILAGLHAFRADPKPAAVNY